MDMEACTTMNDLSGIDYLSTIRVQFEQQIKKRPELTITITDIAKEPGAAPSLQLLRFGPYIRFFVHSDSWALMIRADRGHIEFYSLPIEVMINGQVSFVHLKCKLSRRFDRVWQLDRFPFSGAELEVLVKALFRDLIRRTNKLTLGVSAQAEQQPQSTVTQYLQDLWNQKEILVQKIVLQQEEQQKRIARELHDSVISSLMVLKRNLSAPQDSEKQAASLELLDEVEQRIRLIMHDLAPHNLTDLGLSVVTQDLIDRFAERTGVETQFSSEGSFQHIPESVQIHIYRIAQELLLNIEKHARAETTVVSMRCKPDSFALELIDDGVGLWLDSVVMKPERGAHFGLNSLRERVEIISETYPAVLSFSPRKDRGLIVRLSIALNPLD